jgi:hypothetical protein
MFDVGDIVRCIDTRRLSGYSGLEKGGIYTVLYADIHCIGVTVPEEQFCNYRFELCNKPRLDNSMSSFEYEEAIAAQDAMNALVNR